MRTLREKKPRIIVSFHTTADAMLMEKLCKEGSIPGRLIPVPREISSGCGLAWCSEPEEESRLRKIMEQAGIDGKQLVLLEAA